MFAVIKTGGKQYKVAQGDIIQVEKLPGEAKAKVELGNVLMLCDAGKVTTGAPFGSWTSSGTPWALTIEIVPPASVPTPTV